MILLTDEEIKDAIIKNADLLDKSLDKDRVVAKAQLRKVVEEMEKHSKVVYSDEIVISTAGLGFEADKLWMVLPKSIWQQLRKEAGMEG